MESDYHGQRQTTWFLCKEGVTPSHIQRRLSAVFEHKAPASVTVFSWFTGLQQWQGKWTGGFPWVVSQHPCRMAVRSSGRIQGDGRKVLRRKGLC
jgi:hypothetical protein